MITIISTNQREFIALEIINGLMEENDYRVLYDELQKNVAQNSGQNVEYKSLIIKTQSIPKWSCKESYNLHKKIIRSLRKHGYLRTIFLTDSVKLRVLRYILGVFAFTGIYHNIFLDGSIFFYSYDTNIDEL